MATGPRVVIIGAGIVGCSLADELVLRGWTNVTVVEQGRLFAAGGSTSHAPGLIFQTNSSKTMTEFARYTIEKAATLELDGAWGLNQVGSLELALTPERLAEINRRRDLAASWGVDGRIVDPDEAARLWPYVDRSAILGAYHVPTDGLTKPVRVSEAQARRAMEGGATVLGEHTVTGIRTDDGRVRAVITDRGEIPADIVVCAAGIWGPRVGAMVGMSVPLQPLGHQYAWTDVLPEVAAFGIALDREDRHPIVRAQDRDLYFREHIDRLGVGAYGHVPMPIDPADLCHPADPAVVAMPSVLEFTPDTFAESWAWAQAIVPALRGPGIGVERGINGIFSFTPDGMPLLGESPDVAGFWLAEAVWITHSAGVAKAMAEWLVDGGSPTDLHECDAARFEAHQVAPAFVRERGIQNFVEVYDILHPLQPMESPRPLRASPFYEREQALGAVFLEGSGWERPHWYAANEGLLERYDVPGRNAWAARYWDPIAGAEARATRDAAALYDMTSLKRLEVVGPGALAFLDSQTTNRLDRPVGTVVYTVMLDERGGIRSDLTIARLGPDRFQVGANGNLDLDHLRRAAPADGSVAIDDITAGTCCIGLWGPRVRDILAPLTDADISNETFGYFRARELVIGNVPVTALRLSYVGELGWELYASADLGRRLWDTLWDAGSAYGLIAAGRSAFGSLRLEKGYRSWGADMTTEHDPYEAGLGFAVRLDKGPFVGRDALQRKAATTPARRLVPLRIADREAVVMGKEPVLVDDAVVGYVTSAAYGFTVDAPIAYAWLPSEAAIPGREVAIRYFGEPVGATVATDPLFDPDMARLRV